MANYDRFSGSAGDTFSTITFAKRTKRVTVQALNNNLDFCASYTGLDANMEGNIEIEAGAERDYPLAAKSVKVRNHTPGSVADYEIIAWYVPTGY